MSTAAAMEVNLSPIGTRLDWLADATGHGSWSGGGQEHWDLCRRASGALQWELSLGYNMICILLCFVG